MGINMRFLCLIYAAIAYDAPDCSSDNGDGGGSCSRCGKGTRCVPEACCTAGVLGSVPNGGQHKACRVKINTCGSPSRRLLDEDDLDFDELEDLEMEQAG